MRCGTVHTTSCEASEPACVAVGGVQELVLEGDDHVLVRGDLLPAGVCGGLPLFDAQRSEDDGAHGVAAADEAVHVHDFAAEKQFARTDIKLRLQQSARNLPLWTVTDFNSQWHPRSSPSCGSRDVQHGQGTTPGRVYWARRIP